MEDERVARFDDVRRLHRNWFIPGLALAGFVLGSTMLNRLETLPYGLFMMWIGAWVAPLTLIRNAFQVPVRAHVEATPDELRLDGNAIAAEAIKEARVVQRGRNASEVVVELKLSRWKTIHLRMPQAAASTLVRMLGVEAGQRRASFTLQLPLSTRYGVSFVIVNVPWVSYVMANAAGDAATALGMAIALGSIFAAALAALLGLVRGKITVGADGFTTSWYGRAKHYRFADVESLRRRKHGMGHLLHDTLVRMRGARRDLQLVVRDAPDTHEQRGAEGRALADTMADAYSRWQAAPTVAEVGAHLGRGTRTAKEWLSGIDQLVRGGGNHYRIAAVSPEILAEVTKGSDSSHDARIGAAAALLRLNDKAHRSTIRIAAEACAEPRTRIALLELVEAEDEEAMTKALSRVR